MELTGARWRTSTRSGGNGGACVEVADNLPGVVAGRDSWVKVIGVPPPPISPASHRAPASPSTPCAPGHFPLGDRVSNRHTPRLMLAAEWQRPASIASSYYHRRRSGAMSPAMQRGHLFGGSGAFVVVGAHVAQAAEAQTVAAYTFVARSGATTTDVESKQLSVLGA